LKLIKTESNLMYLRAKIVLATIFLALIFITANFNWGKDRWKDLIGSDGKGYYSYLPAVFIYQDLSFSFFDQIEKQYYPDNTAYDYRSQTQHGIVNKYFAGISVLLLPFFAVGHVITLISDQPADGYSFYYQISVSIAAVFYFCLGLIFLLKILKHFETGEKTALLVVIAYTFGTNVFNYIVVEPSISHVYSFFLISAFCYYSLNFFQSPAKKGLLIISIIYGLIVLVRPVNGICILLMPFLAESMVKLKAGINFIRSNSNNFLLAIVLFLIFPALQLIIYKIQTGHFFVDSYGGESFNFTNPQIINFLFSYKKGFFLYTPLALISLGGLIWFYKTNKFRFYSFCIFILMLFYVLSSWWNWWYGGSFGSRVMIDYYVLFALMFGIFIKNLSNVKRKIIFSLIILCTVLNQIQIYQYRYYILHWENIDKESYWNKFLKLKKN